MTTAHSDSSVERIPGRAWTIRLTGHADRSATLTCSTLACRMPPRSIDIGALRTFAARHAVAHAKVAGHRTGASCHCRAQRCAAHPRVSTPCTVGVVVILRHDPGVGRVWSVEEVCSACAPLIPHATVLTRARPTAAVQQSSVERSSARPRVPGGFSSADSTADSDWDPVRRPRLAPRGSRRRTNRRH